MTLAEIKRRPCSRARSGWQTSAGATTAAAEAADLGLLDFELTWHEREGNGNDRT